MSYYKEIVTKAVIGKGKKTFTTTNEKLVDKKPSTILGCWVINHTFKGERKNDAIIITGSYDVNVWYSYDNDTKTDVVRETNNYKELVNVRKRDDANSEHEEIIIRSLKQPSCTHVEISDSGNIDFDIEKELGVEIVGETKI